MTQNLNRELETLMEKFREDRVWSEYNDDDQRLGIYFDSDFLGYVDASREDERVTIYSMIDGRTIKLEDDSLNVHDIKGSIMAQSAYAESLVFDSHLAQWIREKSYELR